MRRLGFIVAMVACGQSVCADTVVPARVIRAKSVITADAIVLKAPDIPGTFETLTDVIGLEARVALYPGRPIRIEDVGAPALVERNQIVQLVFQSAGMKITTEGRSLGRAASGETLRVMNLSSRTTVTGVVQSNSTVSVRK